MYNISFMGGLAPRKLNTNIQDQKAMLEKELKKINIRLVINAR